MTDMVKKTFMSPSNIHWWAGKQDNDSIFSYYNANSLVMANLEYG